MQRKYNKVEPLTKVISVRLSDRFYNKLEGQRTHSNCQTIGEFARNILEERKVIWYQKDTSKEAIAVELTDIRKELRAIGTNINQVTKYFHGTNIPSQKIFEALKLLDEFKKVQGKIDSLVTVTDKIIQTWSPK